MNQNFSSKQLFRLCKQTELLDCGLSKDELIDEIDENFNDIVAKSFTLDIKQSGDFFLTEDLTQKLVLRKLNDNLKKLYKDEQANRRIIISQVKTLLEENGPMWILKTDIEKFYESISRDSLLSKLQNDTMLSIHSMNILNGLFSHHLISSKTGLPRGINVSATLSEIYMRSFDKWIRRIDGVYYYARFVDDIIVFSYDEKMLHLINKNINKNLAEGLRKKESKTKIFNGVNIKSNNPLEYLGYKFTTETKKNKKHLTVSIADKKINKLKSRITYSLIDFCKTSDYNLLEKRMKFLTGNFSVRKNGDGNDLKAGIYYNYSHVSHLDILDNLNNYYRKALHSKRNNFGKKLSSKLSTTQRETLLKYSFKHGFTNKVYNSFTAEEINNIKTCWA
jgi:hypothetical protein